MPSKRNKEKGGGERGGATHSNGRGRRRNKETYKEKYRTGWTEVRTVAQT